MKSFLFMAISAFVLISCSPTSRVITYPKKADEVFANNNLKTFFKNNPSPTFVLRVPNSNDKATSNTASSKDNNILFNTIEKELLKQGFSVRDRGLFNEIINKSGSTDYSKIKDLTNTDLILEVVNIDPAVIYTTNKVTKVSNKKQITEVGAIDYKRNGASIEFKLITVKNNEIAGIYKYNYQPCPNGCAIGTFSLIGRPKSKGGKEVELKELVSVNELEIFIQRCMQDLIGSFKS
jgi:hypothetical protein